MRHKILLSSYIFYLFSAAPAALADNECGATDGNPATADTAICDPADYDSGYDPDGITYSSDGDFTLQIPDGADQLNVFDGGISVTGNGADNIFLDANAFTNRIEGTDGAIIDYSSDTGNIDIDKPVIFGVGNATHGVRANSMGGGNIDIIAVDINTNTVNNIPEFTAIQAETNGGDITITGDDIRGHRVDGLGRGIIAGTSGDGAILIDVGSVEAGDSRGPIGGIPPGGGATGIYAESGTGNIAIAGEVGSDKIGIHAVTAGEVDLDLTGVEGQGQLGGIGDGLDGIIEEAIGILAEGAQSVTIDLTGKLEGMRTAIRSTGGGDVTVNLANDTVVADPLEQGEFSFLVGNLDFEQAGSVDLTIGDSSAWAFGRSTVFGAGDDVVNIAAGGRVYNQCGGIRLNVGGEHTFGRCQANAEYKSLSIEAAATGDRAAIGMDFGAGDDRFVNAGTLQVGTRYFGTNLSVPSQSDIDTLPAMLRLNDLEHFDNAGSIWLGTVYDAGNILQIDGWNDDILSMPGTTYTGMDGGRILFDVNFNGFGQDACDTSLRAANGDLPVADCVDLRGGATEGSTEIVIANDIIPGDFGAYTPDGTVLVDVEGGTSAAEHFVLSPDSAGYDAELGMIDKRAFLYALGYDPETQQHKLYSLPGQDLHQMPLLAHAAQDLWRDTATSWFERQGNARAALRDGADPFGGVWARVGNDNAERTVSQQVTGGTTTLTFDNSYEQDNRFMNLGVDLFVGKRDDRAWSVGAMIGYGSSDLSFDHRANTANFEGPSVGAYGSFLFGDFFVDAAVTGNWMSFDYDVPSFDLFPDSALLVTDAQTIGAQLEGGWLWQSGRFGVEPLVGLSYATTSFDDIDIPADDPESAGGANVVYDDSTSLRGSLGVRLSMDNVLPGLLPTDLTLTTRLVNETDGEANVAVANTGPVAAPVANTFDGTFTEVTGGVTVRNASGSINGYLNVDGTFESDYESLGLSAGFRYQW